jgi:hypothetical protein
MRGFSIVPVKRLDDLLRSDLIQTLGILAGIFCGLKTGAAIQF